MSKEISIGFTGSRKGMTKEQKEKVLAELEKYHDYTINIYHGDALVQIRIFTTW